MDDLTPEEKTPLMYRILLCAVLLVIAIFAFQLFHPTGNETEKSGRVSMAGEP